MPYREKTLRARLIPYQKLTAGPIGEESLAAKVHEAVVKEPGDQEPVMHVTPEDAERIQVRSGRLFFFKSRKQAVI